MIRHQIKSFFEPLAEPWFWALVVVAGAVGYACGAKPPQMSLKPPQVSIVDPVDYNGLMPPYDAPAGQEWRRYEGLPWVLYPVENKAAPAVAAPRPFAPSPAATTPGTTVPRAAGPSTSFPGTTGTGPTIMYALPAGPFGVINCVGSG